MYDIFADAVLSVDRQLKIGGPGSFKQDFLHDFLEHVCNGINWITGERGTRIDFISHHIYGMSGSWLDEYPLVMPSVQRFNQEILWLSRLIGSYPQLEGAEFHLHRMYDIFADPHLILHPQRYHMRKRQGIIRRWK